MHQIIEEFWNYDAAARAKAVEISHEARARIEQGEGFGPGFGKNKKTPGK